LIEVDRLTKRYGDFLAVEDVSFNVEKGKVLGFLGPNGSGKTTTMRILTCFMPATAGTARICGHDVWEDSMAVRRSIGYMPESVPLYPTMRVNEYLDYRARMKGMDRARRRSSIPRLVEQCGVTEFYNVIIGKLSKGQRQRVGLTATLLGDPPVLILDEPTVGLDPNQIREIRTLVKGLSGDRTVILSTHILPEVEMVCDQVVLIHQGRVALTGSLEEVTRAAAGRIIHVEASGEAPRLKEALEKVTGVKNVACSDKGESSLFDVEVLPGNDVRRELGKAVSEAGGDLLELFGGKTTIEDVFVRITTREG
jgi:gliding motility-associated transport system ATP-binding protein